MTKTIGFSKYGEVDVFEEKNVALTLNAQNDVRVKIEYAGINPVDTMFRSGAMSGGHPLNGYLVLGAEASGVIEELYQPIAGLQVGDQVIVRPGRGGYAEEVVTNHSQVFKVPEGMSMAEAAAFSATAMTAYWGLHGGFYNLKKGDTVAIIGASGSVGSYLVQLAQPLDINVIAVASGKNEDYVKSLGADIFIDYNDQAQIAHYAKTADYVLDASLFNSGEETALILAKENATYVGMTTLPDPAKRPDVKKVFLSRNKQMTEDIAMTALLAFYKEHGLSIQIGYTLPLSVAGVKKAHELVKESRNPGKILLTTHQ